ncbi:hypothetical protein CVT25_002454 [Psilocybe cyanescens]|uniref:Uncharacterized protein n=1 Tax=Psilocybe cyanescens TaxID=93625 RepID=A0A409X6I6_PSICY|nr:hypothetical protein CVT25_002454 [Psilocybe cyanescens]
MPNCISLPYAGPVPPLLLEPEAQKADGGTVDLERSARFLIETPHISQHVQWLVLTDEWWVSRRVHPHETNNLFVLGRDFYRSITQIFSSALKIVPRLTMLVLCNLKMNAELVRRIAEIGTLHTRTASMLCPEDGAAEAARCSLPLLITIGQRACVPAGVEPTHIHGLVLQGDAQPVDGLLMCPTIRTLSLCKLDNLERLTLDNTNAGDLAEFVRFLATPGGAGGGTGAAQRMTHFKLHMDRGLLDADIIALLSALHTAHAPLEEAERKPAPAQARGLAVHVVGDGVLGCNAEGTVRVCNGGAGPTASHNSPNARANDMDTNEDEDSAAETPVAEGAAVISWMEGMHAVVLACGVDAVADDARGSGLQEAAAATQLNWMPQEREEQRLRQEELAARYAHYQASAAALAARKEEAQLEEEEEEEEEELAKAARHELQKMERPKQPKAGAGVGTLEEKDKSLGKAVKSHMMIALIVDSVQRSLESTLPAPTSINPDRHAKEV